jgi:hypothetical protein
MNSIADYLKSNRKPAGWALIGALTLFAFAQRYPVDDAFISFRYARFLADGLGLVWNLGERVEGYTNFLWTILIAGGMALDIEPERFVILLTFPIYLAGLWLIFRTTEIWTGSTPLALLTTLIVGISRSVYAFATSGMETTLQMTQFLYVIYLLTNIDATGWSERRASLLSLLLTTVVLNRPDGFLAVLIVGLTVYRERERLSRRQIVNLIVPFVSIITIYFGWKLIYYGALLPNSFYIKVQDLLGVLYGLMFLHLFALSHLFHVFILLAAFQAHKLREWSPGIREAGVLCTLWAVYSVAVGGDFMEFRFLVPIIPLLIMVFVAMINRIETKTLRAGLLAGLLGGAIHSNFAMEELLRSYGVENVTNLRAHLQGNDENWVGLGKKLKEYFGGTDVLISAGAAGAIPYYSDLRTIDFLGLTDRNIAEDHEKFSRVPGHRIIARVDYLVDRKVNLIIEPNNHMIHQQDFPLWVQQLSWRDAYSFYLDPDGNVNGEPLNRVTLLAIPVDEEHTLIAWYLTPHPAIEEMIIKRDWKTYQVSRWQM